MRDPTPSSFALRVPTELARVRLARVMVEGLLRAEGCPSDDVDDAGLLVTEVLQNAIEHGSANDGSEWISISCRLEGRRVTLDVVDPGTGGDPRHAVACDASEAPPLDAERGRGLFLIHRLATAWDRCVTPHGGLRVVVHKEVAAS